MARKILGLILLLLPLAASCGPAPERGAGPARVILIGIESLSLLQVETMVARGELPNFAALIHEGTRATLVSPDPLLSPMLWATLLTGQGALQHQMSTAYVQLDGGAVLAPSSMRSVPTLFQILSARHQLVASIGFPGTWPAEVLNGFNLSYGALPSRMVETSEHTYPRRADDRAAFPANLQQRAMDHYTPVEGLDRKDTARFFVLNESEFSMLYDQPLGSILQLENPLRDFGLTLQRDRAQVALAEDLLGEFPLRMVGIHLELTDALQPVYWPAEWPDHYTIPANSQRRFHETINECYRTLDGWLGRIRAAAGDDALICVVGDRGFGHGTDPMASPDAPGQLKPTMLNETLLILGGPGIRRDTRLARVRLADVTPTLLTALDIPVGSAMQGSVLDAAFTPEFLAAHPRKATEPYTEAFRSTPRYPSQYGESTASPERETP